MDKVAVIGYMYELDKELRKRMSHYPFSQIILEQAMNNALETISKCSDSSFSDKETAIGAIDLSIKGIFRRDDFPLEHKYWDSEHKYIGSPEYNKENLDYNAFKAYTTISNQNSSYFIGGAKFCMDNYDLPFKYSKNKKKGHKIHCLFKAIVVIAALAIAYLWASNGRYYISEKGIVIDKWKQEIITWKDFK